MGRELWRDETRGEETGDAVASLFCFPLSSPHHWCWTAGAFPLIGKAQNPGRDRRPSVCSSLRPLQTAALLAPTTSSSSSSSHGAGVRWKGQTKRETGQTAAAVASSSSSHPQASSARRHGRRSLTIRCPLHWPPLLLCVCDCSANASLAFCVKSRTRCEQPYRVAKERDGSAASGLQIRAVGGGWPGEGEAADSERPPHMQTATVWQRTHASCHVRRARRVHQAALRCGAPVATQLAAIVARLTCACDARRMRACGLRGSARLGHCDGLLIPIALCDRAVRAACACAVSGSVAPL